MLLDKLEFLGDGQGAHLLVAHEVHEGHVRRHVGATVGDGYPVLDRDVVAQELTTQHAVVAIAPHEVQVHLTCDGATLGWAERLPLVAAEEGAEGDERDALEVHEGALLVTPLDRAYGVVGSEAQDLTCFCRGDLGATGGEPVDEFIKPLEQHCRGDEHGVLEEEFVGADGGDRDERDGYQRVNHEVLHFQVFP